MDVVKALAGARESVYFKQEQEVDLQRYRTRLISLGKLEDAAGANLGLRRQHSFQESIAAFEVLPEVLQQQARVDDPNAAARRETIRRIKAMPLRLTEAEVLRYRSSVYGVAAAIGHVPQMHLGRNRWHMAATPASLAPARALTPQEAEMASRAYATGVRSLAWGSALGFLGVAIMGTLAVQSLGVTSLQDLQRLRDPASPFQQGLQQRAADMRAWLQSLVGKTTSAQGRALAVAAGDGSVPADTQHSQTPTHWQAGPERSEFSQRLAARYNPSVTRPGTTTKSRAADIL